MSDDTKQIVVDAPITRLLTIEQVAEALQVEPRTIRTWCQKGELEYVKLSHKALRFKAVWIDEFIERQQRGGTRRSGRLMKIRKVSAA